jgi:hypothetical protein
MSTSRPATFTDLSSATGLTVLTRNSGIYLFNGAGGESHVPAQTVKSLRRAKSGAPQMCQARLSYLFSARAVSEYGNKRAVFSPGTIISKALEPLAGRTGEILVLLSLQ